MTTVGKRHHEKTHYNSKFSRHFSILSKEKGPMVFTKRPFSLHLIFTWSAHLESNQGYPVICWKRVYKSRVLPLHYERIFGVVGGIRASNLPLQRGCSTVKLTRHNMVGHCGFDPHSPAFQAGAITSSADAPYKSQPLPGKICFRPYASTHIRCSVDPHLNKKVLHIYRPSGIRMVL